MTLKLEKSSVLERMIISAVQNIDREGMIISSSGGKRTPAYFPSMGSLMLVTSMVPLILVTSMGPHLSPWSHSPYDRDYNRRSHHHLIIGSPHLPQDIDVKYRISAVGNV